MSPLTAVNGGMGVELRILFNPNKQMQNKQTMHNLKINNLRV